MWRSVASGLRGTRRRMLSAIPGPSIVHKREGLITKSQAEIQLERLGFREGRQKKALLVGCNYPDSCMSLFGCHNDVFAARQMLLTRYGFTPNDIKLIIDEPGTNELPTGARVMLILKDLVSGIGEEGRVFLHFSGHGTRFPFGRRHKIMQAIVLSDFNLMTKFDFLSLLDCLPKGAKFTFFADCCYSGGLFDERSEQIGPKTLVENARLVPYEAVLDALDGTRGRDIGRDIKTVMLEKFGAEASLLFRGLRDRPKPLDADGILLSACKADELAYETMDDKGVPYGLFTLAVQIILKENLLAGLVTNYQIVMKAREVMQRLNVIYKQSPCLYCDDCNVHRNFLS